MDDICELCGQDMLMSDRVIDARGDVYCIGCVEQLIDQGIYNNIDEFQGYND